MIAPERIKLMHENMSMFCSHDKASNWANTFGKYADESVGRAINYFENKELKSLSKNRFRMQVDEYENINRTDSVAWEKYSTEERMEHESWQPDELCYWQPFTRKGTRLDMLVEGRFLPSQIIDRNGDKWVAFLPNNDEFMHNGLYCQLIEAIHSPGTRLERSCNPGLVYRITPRAGNEDKGFDQGFYEFLQDLPRSGNAMADRYKNSFSVTE